MEKRPAIICDLDGTVACNAHRQHFLDGKKKDWDGFFGAMNRDKPKENVIKAIRLFSIDTQILWVTGRPDTYKLDTVNWLRYIARLPKEWPLFMRPFVTDPYTPDDIVKRNIYNSVIRPFYDVKLVLDDRAKVVKMWRKEGLECWQVAEGDF